ncbi:MAG: low molecular weight protein-tyrosine-phosphatase [Adlercreutzia sp.]|nr:low molecular weight protein-tyrosine-phosphatase [Adlercreutzia sp.]
MHRILFVCHGNICRSTMAEFVLKDMVQRRGEADRFVIASAATSTEEIGNPVHPGTQRALRERGIGGFEKKRARQLRRDDYDQYDLLIGMDEANIRNMTRMLGGDPEGKVHLLLEFAGETSAIADPWYTGDFEATYRDVAAGCEGLLRELEER